MNRNIPIGAAIVLALLAAGAVAPIFGSLCAFFVPLPVLFYRVKSGRRTALAIAAISFIVLTVLARGLKFDLIYTAQLLAIGMALGEGFAANASINRTFVTALAALAGLTVIWIIGACIARGVGPLTLFAIYIDGSINTTMAFYEARGVNETDLAALRQVFESIKPAILKLALGIGLLIYIVVIWANIIVSRMLFKYAKMPWPDFGNLQEWSTPSNLVFAAILGALLAIIFPKTGNIYYVGLTIVLVLFPFYCFQGLAVISFIFTKLGAPPSLQMAVYLLIIVMFLPLFGIAAIGFFDAWFNFRRLGKTQIDTN